MSIEFALKKILVFDEGTESAEVATSAVLCTPSTIIYYHEL